MRKIEVTAFDIAERYIGMKEVSGKVSNPAILAMLQLDNSWPQEDEVPWCSGFVNYICWLLRLPRSKSLMARSWLQIGRVGSILDVEVGFDVVILKRGGDKEPGPEIINAPGHVGFFAGYQSQSILLLGGNQGDSVTVSPFSKNLILGIRKLYE